MKRVSTSTFITPSSSERFSSALLNGGPPHPCASPAQGWDLFLGHSTVLHLILGGDAVRVEFVWGRASRPSKPSASSAATVAHLILGGAPVHRWR